MARRWTAQEDRKLIEGASANTLAWLRKQAGRSYHDGDLRSRASIYSRAKRLWGRGGLRRGVFSYADLERMSGYSVTALRRAGQALGHRYRRLSKRGAYLITYEQREDIFAWLRNDYWSIRKLRYSCLWCNTSAIKHKGSGLCEKCWWHHRRLCDKLGLSCRPQEQYDLLLRGGLSHHSELIERHRVKGWALPKATLEAWFSSKTTLSIDGCTSC